MIKTLTILLPIIFVKAISVEPCFPTATRLTTNSGAEVPKATMVKPMIKSDTFNLFAKPAEPSTKKFAPAISRANPTIINT